MELKALNHICVIVKDMERSRAFYESFLELSAHPRVEGWYRTSAGPVLHLIAIDEAERPGEDDWHHYYRHFAFEVEDLRRVVKRALAHELQCFMMDTEGEEHYIKVDTDPLSFGIRTLFIRDPDDNLWEFVQRGHSWSELWG